MDVLQIQAELLRREYPHLLPNEDPDIERYFFLRNFGKSREALNLYQVKLKPRYPNNEFRTVLLRLYRNKNPAYRQLQARAYQALGARCLEKLKRLIIFIADRADSYNPQDVYSTIKAAELIKQVLPRDRYEAISTMERFIRYSQVLNLRTESLYRATELIRAYLNDNLTVVEEERRRREDARKRAVEEQRRRLSDLDVSAYGWNNKPAPSGNLMSAVFFSLEDLARIEIPRTITRPEDKTLAYCAKYWNRVGDQAFERLLFLYSRKFGVKNYDVFKAIQRGRQNNKRDDEILASVMSCIITGYYYSVLGDHYVQRQWVTIKANLFSPAGRSAAAPRPAVHQPAAKPVAAPTPAVRQPAAAPAAVPTSAVQQPAAKPVAVPTPAVRQPAARPTAVPAPAVQQPASRPAGVPVPAVQQSAAAPAPAPMSAVRQPAARPTAVPTSVVRQPADRPAAAPTPAVQQPASRPAPAPTPAVQQPAARPAAVPVPAVQQPADRPAAVPTPAVQQPAASTAPAPTSAVRQPASRPALAPTPAVQQPAARPAAAPTSVVRQPADRPTAVPTPVVQQPAASTAPAPTSAVRQPASRPAAAPTPAVQQPAARPALAPTSVVRQPADRPAAVPTPAVQQSAARPALAPTSVVRQPADRPVAAPTPAVQQPAASTEKTRRSVSQRLQELSGRSYDVFQDRFLAHVRPAIRKVLSVNRGMFFNPPLQAEDIVFDFLQAHYNDPYMNWEDSEDRIRLAKMGFDLNSIIPVIDECYAML